MALGKKRVAVTGMGIISCLGLSREAVEQALRRGRCGLACLPERKELGFQSALSGRIEGFDPEKTLNRKRRKSLPEFGLWAWAALKQAISQAGLELASLQNERTGFLFGNDSSTVAAVEQVDALRAAGETKAIGSGQIFRLPASTVTLNLGTMLGIRGMTWTVSSACASGAMAVGQAAELIAAGRQDRMLCGGAQEITWQSMCSFDALGAFSRREDDPAGASRPFDQARDGLVPSGGAAALLLESFEEAEARGAPVLGEVIGYGTASDGYHIAIPNGDGLRRAMLAALDTAGLRPAEIDLLLAHATSTPIGDRAEAQALQEIFGSAREGALPHIVALKALTGHEFWMAGASQLVYGLIMAGGGFAVGNHNLKQPDPATEGLLLPTRTVDLTPRHLLCNAAGFGGTNACLLIRTRPR